MIKLDKKRYKRNPNALACFLPVKVYPDVPRLELRKEAFHTLENNLTVSEDSLGNQILAPLVFSDIVIDAKFADVYKRVNGEIVCLDELSVVAGSLF